MAHSLEPVKLRMAKPCTFFTTLKQMPRTQRVPFYLKESTMLKKALQNNDNFFS